jgi:antitoxin component of MazEF toxin-antitoxin module
LKTYRSEVVEVLDNGDAIIDLPQELLDDVGWKVGDNLTISMENGSIILSKLIKEENE